MSERTLPDYTNPPLIEVVFGIQFQELKKLKSPHTGLLWNIFGRDKYPTSQEMPPIAHSVEEFPAKPKTEEVFKIEQLGSPPLPRIFLVNNEGDSLIQIQRDRFHRNWKKVKDDSEYPRFDTLYPEFIRDVELFNKFLEREGIGKSILDQYELTYVNHIPLSIIDGDLSKINKIFPEFVCYKEDRFLAKPERFFCRRVYEIDEQMGRLHVVIKQAKNMITQQELFVLELTARGFGQTMNEWFALAREWIVKGFADLTDLNTQKSVWGRKS